MLEGFTILLAEDNPTNQMVAMQMLEALGAEVVLAVDGVDALEKLSHRRFDVLLVDIEMPRMNGIDVIRSVRKDDEAHRDATIIALTAYVMREHREAIDAAGADGVIAKPIISITDFGREILAFCEARRDRVVANSAPAMAARDLEPEGRDPVNTETLDALGRAVGEAALGEILVKAISDFQSSGRRLRQGADASDIAEVRSATHILIGLAGTVGADRLDARLQGLQDRVHAGDTAALADEAERIASEIDAVCGMLGSYVAP